MARYRKNNRYIQTNTQWVKTVGSIACDEPARGFEDVETEHSFFSPKYQTNFRNTVNNSGLPQTAANYE